MILVDERTGSRELLSLIRGFGCDAELTHLDAADFAFTGCGDPDVCASPFIGIERKVLDSDLIQSMRSRRLAGSQVIKMSHIFDESYIIVEGIWKRERSSGYVIVPGGKGNPWRQVRGSVKYAEVDRFLCSLEIQGGIHIWRTSDEEETAAAVADRYLWWQKPWAEHSAMSSVYAPEGERRKGHKPSMRRESTLAEKVASQLPGVDSKAVVVAAHFGSVARMMAATEKEWMQVEGVGKVGAKRIMEAISAI